MRGYTFPIAMWAASRLVVALVVLAAAPAVGAEPFALWDGGWYQRIAADGYEYAADGGQHSVAFFPLYPLLLRLSGLHGAIVSHLAFLGALCVAFAWARDRWGEPAARWTCAALAWFPLAAFCSFVYSEALFLLVTACALRAFDQGRYGWAAFWGALASATRVTGVLLAPAMAWAAWRARLPGGAWAAAAASTAGLAAFMAFCAAAFGDPLAFLHAQAGWRSGLGVDAAGWWALWREPGMWGEAIPKTLFLGGGVVLLWRAGLGPLPTAYGLLSLAVILASGSPASVDRYVYGVLPVAAALGLLLARHPRVGGGALVVMAAFMISAALRFARGQWVA